MDEQSTKSNGYYNLENSIVEELKHGIFNFNYHKQYPPILFNDFELILNYKKSHESYCVQAADLVAGNVRHKRLKYDTDIGQFNKELDFVDYKIFLP